MAYFYSPSGKSIDRVAGKGEWGIDPDDGLYAPVTREEHATWLKRRAELAVIGGGDSGAPESGAKLTPATIEAVLSDRSLALALKAMTAKLSSGEFARVGRPLAEMQAELLRRERLERERDEIRKNLEAIERELSASGPKS